MKGQVALDANLNIFLVVGSANVDWIERHKKLKDRTIYNVRSFIELERVISEFSGIVFLPNVLTEVSNQFGKGMFEPALGQIRAKFLALVEGSDEHYVNSVVATKQASFNWLGLTDAALLVLCSRYVNDGPLTILTADQSLAVQALSLDLSVINYCEYLATL